MNALPPLKVLMKSWASQRFTSPLSDAHMLGAFEGIASGSELKGVAIHHLRNSVFPRDRFEMVARFLALPNVAPVFKNALQKMSEEEIVGAFSSVSWMLEKHTGAGLRDNSIATEEMMRRLALVFDLSFEGETDAQMFSQLQAYDLNGVKTANREASETFETAYDKLSKRALRVSNSGGQSSAVGDSDAGGDSSADASDNERKDPSDRGWRE